MGKDVCHVLHFDVVYCLLQLQIMWGVSSGDSKCRWGTARLASSMFNKIPTTMHFIVYICLISITLTRTEKGLESPLEFVGLPNVVKRELGGFEIV